MARPPGRCATFLGQDKNIVGRRTSEVTGVTRAVEGDTASMRCPERITMPRLFQEGSANPTRYLVKLSQEMLPSCF